MGYEVDLGTVGGRPRVKGSVPPRMEHVQEVSPTVQQGLVEVPKLPTEQLHPPERQVVELVVIGVAGLQMDPALFPVVPTRQPPTTQDPSGVRPWRGRDRDGDRGPQEPGLEGEPVGRSSGVS